MSLDSSCCAFCPLDRQQAVLTDLRPQQKLQKLLFLSQPGPCCRWRGQQMSPVTPESLFSSAGEEMGSILASRTVITSDWCLCFPVHFLAQQEMSVQDNYSEGLVLEGFLPTLAIFNCLSVRKCFLVDFSPQYFSVPRDALNWGKITLCWHWWKTFSCFTSESFR